MKNFFSSMMIFVLALAMTSCDKEEMDDLGDLDTSGIEAEMKSPIGTIVSKSSDPNNNGEIDCFDVNFPMDIQYPDGTTATANDYLELKSIYEVFYADEANQDEYLLPAFPFSVTLEDETVKDINDEDELKELFKSCKDWGYDDDDDDWDDDDYEKECFDFVYPITVVYPDGSTQVANDEDELEDIYDVFYDDEANDDLDLTFEFPLSIDWGDGEVEQVASEEDLEALFEECDDWDDHDDGCFDDDDELEDLCFDFNFPITIVYPDASTADANNLEEMMVLIEDFYDDDPDEDLTLDFPITVTLEDGTQESIADEDALEELIDDCE